MWITVYWFQCPECEHTWGAEQSVPDREWCVCGTVDEPEFLYQEEVKV